jgi:hypothetical protein
MFQPWLFRTTSSLSVVHLAAWSLASLLSQCYPSQSADTYTYPNTEPYTGANTHSYADANAYPHAYAYSDAYANTYKSPTSCGRILQRVAGRVW